MSQRNLDSDSRREHHCGFCLNHDIKKKKNNHRDCEYSNCPCILCQLTRTAQLVMKYQQAVWRHLNQGKEMKKQFKGQQVNLVINN